MRKVERIRSPAPESPPAPGRFVWLCRNGFERYLFEELARERLKPRVLCGGAVECDLKSGVEPVFGRAGFRVTERLGPKGRVEAWTLDTPEGNRSSQAVRAAADAAKVEPGEQRLVLCGFSSELMVTGDLPTAAPKRMRRDAETISRAAFKLEEALEWVGDAPARSELCVDLGAAPGGWSQRLLTRGARVVAVDPAKLKIQSARLKHVQDSAFRFEPDESADWLFCDMAWRPLEVAQLLGKWGRRQWAIRLVANIKLPMKEKWPMLERVRATLEAGGWRGVKMRQLYHDRDEVTVAATRY